MRKFVGKEMPTLIQRGANGLFPIRHVGPQRNREGVDRSCSFGCPAVVVYANLTEVETETRLEESTGGPVVAASPGERSTSCTIPGAAFATASGDPARSVCNACAPSQAAPVRLRSSCAGAAEGLGSFPRHHLVSDATRLVFERIVDASDGDLRRYADARSCTGRGNGSRDWSAGKTGILLKSRDRTGDSRGTPSTCRPCGSPDPSRSGSEPVVPDCRRQAHASATARSRRDAAVGAPAFEDLYARPSVGTGAVLPCALKANTAASLSGYGAAGKNRPQSCPISDPQHPPNSFFPTRRYSSRSHDREYCASIEFTDDILDMTSSKSKQVRVGSSSINVGRRWHPGRKMEHGSRSRRNRRRSLRAQRQVYRAGRRRKPEIAWSLGVSA